VVKEVLQGINPKLLAKRLENLALETRAIVAQKKSRNSVIQENVVLQEVYDILRRITS